MGSFSDNQRIPFGNFSRHVILYLLCERLTVVIIRRIALLKFRRPFYDGVFFLRLDITMVFRSITEPLRKQLLQPVHSVLHLGHISALHGIGRQSLIYRSYLRSKFLNKGFDLIVQSLILCFQFCQLFHRFPIGKHGFTGICNNLFISCIIGYIPSRILGLLDLFLYQCINRNLFLAIFCKKEISQCLKFSRRPLPDKMGQLMGRSKQDCILSLDACVDVNMNTSVFRIIPPVIAHVSTVLVRL